MSVKTFLPVLTTVTWASIMGSPLLPSTTVPCTRPMFGGIFREDSSSPPGAGVLGSGVVVGADPSSNWGEPASGLEVGCVVPASRSRRPPSGGLVGGGLAVGGVEPPGSCAKAIDPNATRARSSLPIGRIDPSIFGFVTHPYRGDRRYAVTFA